MFKLMKITNKYNVDVVIISDSKNEQLKKMMYHTINTLYNSEDNINFYTYIVESSDIDFTHLHKNIKMVKPIPPFGYHKYLNLGRKLGTSKYVCLCNNDLEFKHGWATAIINEMEKDNKLLSASPISRNPHMTEKKLKVCDSIKYGYKIRLHVTGWCIFQQRKIYDIIGDLDEKFTFWYCDNDYARNLEIKGIKHALIQSSQVDHLVSKTLNTKKGIERNKLTKQQLKVFQDKWKNMKK